MGTTPLTQKDILNILKELIITHDNNRLGLEYYDIRITSTLTDLGFDSLDIPEFSMNVESKFKIRIEDEEVEQIFMRKTIEEIMTFVHTRQVKCRDAACSVDSTNQKQAKQCF